jgi:hypothetical protein
MFLPDPDFYPSRIPDTTTAPKILLLGYHKKWVLGPGSKIRDPGSGKKPIPDPGSGVKKAPDPESRILIRNTSH